MITNGSSCIHEEGPNQARQRDLRRVAWVDRGVGVTGLDTEHRSNLQGGKYCLLGESFGNVVLHRAQP